MNKEIEEKFVKTFVERDKRDRLLFELLSKKKRDIAIQRLYNSLDRKYKVIEDNKIKDKELLSVIKPYINMEAPCYVIADSVDDGNILPFKTAFDKMINGGMAYAILYGDNIVIMKDEMYYGAPMKIFLKK